MQLGTSFAVDVTDALQTGAENKVVVTWMIGSMRDPVVFYRTPSGDVHQRSPYFRSQFSSISSIVSFSFSSLDMYNSYRIKVDTAIGDFANASARADAFDKKIVDMAKNTSDTYAQLVAVSARAIMGATELTVSNGTDGSFNTSDAKMFMLDVGTSE